MKPMMNFELLHFGKYHLYVKDAVELVVFILIIYAILYVKRQFIYRSHRLDVSKKYSVNKLMNYLLIVLATIIGLYILHVDLTVLLAGSAALLVGIGFGLQHLFNDFISGIILLLDATLKVGDIIEVNGMIYKVQEINFRTTTVIGRDDNYIIVPNSELTSNKVINWTHGALTSRFRVGISVDYETDLDIAIPLLIQSAISNDKILNDPSPFIRLEDYGASGLQMSVYFYSNEVFRIESIKSEVRIELFRLFKQNGIKVPYPRNVVELKNSDATELSKNIPTTS
jgi:small-conductance mechanosensitive channel